MVSNSLILQSSPALRIVVKLKTLNSILNICAAMDFNLLFNLFGSGGQDSFKKWISCFSESPFNFPFFMSSWISNGKLVLGLMVFSGRVL